LNRTNIDKFIKRAKNKPITFFLFEEEGIQKIKEFLDEEKLI
jgi:hypothetical protein